MNMSEWNKDFSCPFTWGMESVLEHQNKLLETKNDLLEMILDAKDDFPEALLMYHLMLVYENVRNNNVQSATKCINDAEKVLNDIKKNATLSNVENPLQHIFVGTKCHVLVKLGQITKAAELSKGICKVEDMNNTELAMLNGCRCLAWSNYFMSDNLQAVKYAKRAIELDPDNSKWYYWFGKNQRQLRKTQSRYPAEEEEISAFAKAYSISKNPSFGISLARAYREAGNYNKANYINQRVYDSKPTSCSVRLQLAKGFIRASDWPRAQACLEYVAEKMPDSNLYNHYMGIYLEKRFKNHKGALPYFESAIARLNFGAEWQYMQCRRKVEPNWDPLPYMLDLIKKYESSSDHVIQEICIQVGLYYLLKLKDLVLACEYLTKAIKIKPDSKQLQRPFYSFGRTVNVYHTLTKVIQSALQNRNVRYNDTTIAIFNDTLELCRNNSS